jgi:hypothetical protein
VYAAFKADLMMAFSVTSQVTEITRAFSREGLEENPELAFIVARDFARVKEYGAIGGEQLFLINTAYR